MCGIFTDNFEVVLLKQESKENKAKRVCVGKALDDVCMCACAWMTVIWSIDDN